MVLFYSVVSSVVDIERLCKENKYGLCENENITKVLCSITSPNIECIFFRMRIGAGHFLIFALVILVSASIFLCLQSLCSNICSETREIINETAELVVKVEQ
jgi:hypothetical protein